MSTIPVTFQTIHIYRYSYKKLIIDRHTSNIDKSQIHILLILVYRYVDTCCLGSGNFSSSLNYIHILAFLEVIL